MFGPKKSNKYKYWGSKEIRTLGNNGVTTSQNWYYIHLIGWAAGGWVFESELRFKFGHTISTFNT